MSFDLGAECGTPHRTWTNRICALTWGLITLSCRMYNDRIGALTGKIKQGWQTDVHHKEDPEASRLQRGMNRVCVLTRGQNLEYLTRCAIVANALGAKFRISYWMCISRICFFDLRTKFRSKCGMCIGHMCALTREQNSLYLTGHALIGFVLWHGGKN